MDRIPIALQLYSIREDCARDLEGSIKAVAEMGYEGVEFAGYYQRGADELKSLCDAHGLQIVGTHIGLDTLQGDALEETVEFNKTLGNRYLIVPGLSEERRNSRAAWLETAGLFDEIAGNVQKGDHQIAWTPSGLAGGTYLFQVTAELAKGKQTRVGVLLVIPR